MHEGICSISEILQTQGYDLSFVAVAADVSSLRPDWTRLRLRHPASSRFALLLIPANAQNTFSFQLLDDYY